MEGSMKRCIGLIDWWMEGMLDEWLVGSVLLMVTESRLPLSLLWNNKKTLKTNNIHNCAIFLNICHSKFITFPNC